MSVTDIQRYSAPSPARIGQATAVEQSRAAAEVQAMVIIAQQMPRDVDEAVREMQRSCSRKGVAEKAFYRYRRGSGQVTGESIVLAKELARCWGNIDYGLAELRRDDIAGESEMMAFAWDLQKNTRPRTTFIVPHVRMGTSTRLTDSRDVYENNTNAGNRRMREMILNLLPPWFIEDAKELCYRTMAADDSDGKTIAERAAKAVERFAGIGVRPEQLTQKLGAPQAAWSAADLAQLSVIFRSIERGETTAEDEFGPSPARIKDSDLAPSKNVPPGGAQPDTSPSPAAQPDPPQAPVSPPGAPAGGTSKPRPATTGQVGMIRKKFEELYPGDETDADRWERLGQTARLAGIDTDVTSLGSTNELTSEQAVRVRKRLDSVSTAAELEALIARIASGEVRDGE